MTQSEVLGYNASHIKKFAEVDAFGRGRVSLPFTQFDYQNQYNEGPLVWETAVVGTGAIAQRPAEASVRLTTGGTAGAASVVRQTRQYFRYRPGKGQYILMTGVFGAPATNVLKRIGYHDGASGVFFQQTSTGLSVGVRSSTSGSVVDTLVVQADWSVDPMDGTGPSGIVLDQTKAQILYFDLEWLGVGRVRFGLNVGGNTYIVHEQKHSNLISMVYMGTCNLPLRYEIMNTGTAAAATTIDQICASVMTEGGADDEGFYTHSVGNGITGISVTTRRAALSIRPKATFNSIVNRGKIDLETFDLAVSGNSVYWEIIYNGTIGGTPTWNSAGDNSIVEFDIAGTTITGGEVIAAGYAVTGTGSAKGTLSKAISDKFPLTLDIAGANPKNMSIVCTSFTGTAACSGAMTFKEYY